MKFHLIASFPVDNHPRLEEFGTCLRLNMMNRHIGKITILTDVFKIPTSTHFCNLISDFGVSSPKNRTISPGNEIYIQNSWPKYNDAFKLANKTKSMIGLIANGDIFFDDSLLMAREFVRENHFLSITRREASMSHDPVENHLGIRSWKDEIPPYTKTGVCEPSSIMSMKPSHFRGSSDAWIFKTPIKEFGEDTEIGTSFCDHAISSLAKQAGYTVLNPCLDIAANHLHKATEGRHKKARSEKKYRKGIEIPSLIPIIKQNT